MSAARELSERKFGRRVYPYPLPWYAAALVLVRRHYPTRLAEAIQVEDDWAPDWLCLFRWFLRQVEADNWFEVDWDQLDCLWQMAVEIEVEDEDDAPYGQPDGLVLMSEYLNFVPIQVYGWSVESEPHDPGQCPPVLLLRSLLVNAREVGWTNAEIADFDVFDRVRTLTGWPLAAAWRRMAAVDRDLFDVARWATGQTGNILLDSPPADVYDQLPCTWQRDSDRLRAAYAGAAPRLERLREIVGRWDSEGDLERIYSIVMGVRL